MSAPHLVLSRRIRKTPFEQRVIERGATHFSVYNHMTLPLVFASLEEDYAHLCEHVQLWDVSSERQVEVSGPDAMRLCELVTPRDLSVMSVGQGLYAPLVDEKGGIVNDPIILKLASERFWVSISDSDVLLWLKGLATGFGMDVDVFEPDVSPLAVQGPKAEDLLAELLGEDIRAVRFFRFIEKSIAGTDVLIARSGWSGKGGFEIYLQDSAKGLEVWDTVFEAGEKYNIRAGCPNQIERMETGLLSYGSDMTLANSPAECGLNRFYSLGKKAEYLGRDALERIERQGVSQKLVNLRLAVNHPLALRSTWQVELANGQPVGMVTSQSHSLQYRAVLAYAYLAIETVNSQEYVYVVLDDGTRVKARQCDHKWEPLNA